MTLSAILKGLDCNGDHSPHHTFLKPTKCTLLIYYTIVIVVPRLRISGAVPPISMNLLGMERHNFALSFLVFHLINS